MKTVQITRGTVAGGQTVKAGDVLELTDYDAHVVVSYGAAIYAESIVLPQSDSAPIKEPLPAPQEDAVEGESTTAPKRKSKK